jgi:hypothetical protein
LEFFIVLRAELAGALKTVLGFEGAIGEEEDVA